jgi:hypothetical protein
MNTYEGFIFGHYDSRGGGTFIEDANELNARKRYIEMGNGLEYEKECAERWSKEEGASPEWANILALRDDEEALIRYLTEEDFIAPAKLESYRPISEGEDLEWNEHGEQRELANAFDEGLQWASPEVEETTANPYKELLWWNEELRELKLCEPGVNPGQPNETYGTSYWPERERIPGWKRSSFGEDACGLVFVSRNYTE